MKQEHLLQQQTDNKGTLRRFTSRRTRVGVAAGIALLTIFVLVLVLATRSSKRRSPKLSGNFLTSSDLIPYTSNDDDTTYYIYWDQNHQSDSLPIIFVFTDYCPNQSGIQAASLAESTCGSYGVGYETVCPSDYLFCLCGAAWKIDTVYNYNDGSEQENISVNHPSCDFTITMAAKDNDKGQYVSMIFADLSSGRGFMVIPIVGVDTSNLSVDSGTFAEDVVTLLKNSDSYQENMNNQWDQERQKLIDSIIS